MMKIACGCSPKAWLMDNLLFAANIGTFILSFTLSQSVGAAVGFTAAVIVIEIVYMRRKNKLKAQQSQHESCPYRKI